MYHDIEVLFSRYKLLVDFVSALFKLDHFLLGLLIKALHLSLSGDKQVTVVHLAIELGLETLNSG